MSDNGRRKGLDATNRTTNRAIEPRVRVAREALALTVGPDSSDLH